MFAFTLGTYELPFLTFPIVRRKVQHRHTNPDGSTWIEPMDLTTEVIALDLQDIHPACNDNMEPAYA